MKYRIVFSPDLEIDEDMFREFVEKWNTDESCKKLCGLSHIHHAKRFGSKNFN